MILKIKMLSFWAICLLFMACHPKVVPVATPATSGNNSTETIVGTTPKEGTTQPELVVDLPTDAPVIFLKKTPCFGKCPVFEIRIAGNGAAEWKGTKNVERLGNYTAQIPAAIMAEIMTEAESIGYFKFESQYPANGKKIADFPLTITSIRFKNQEQIIENNFDAPPALQGFEQFLFQKLDQLDWKMN
jgi:hypothetical protein